jgi:hypothetical protein
MNDTRDTMTARLDAPRAPADNENGEDIMLDYRPAPRFNVGDKVIPAGYPDRVFTLVDASIWDYEFSGWLIFPGMIGVHECNFILESEREQWEPHADGLWSWWTRTAEVAP